MSTQTPNGDNPTDERYRDYVEAYQNTPAGATIRLRGYGLPEDWMSAVEVVSADEHVTTLYEGTGIEATQVYNRTIDVFTELEARDE